MIKLKEDDDEELLSDLLKQVQSEASKEIADEFATMLDQCRDGGALFMVTGEVVLKNLALAFGLGRRYEAVIQNDMRADKEA